MLKRLASGVERIRKRNLGAWTGGYLRWLARTTVPRAVSSVKRSTGPRHILFALCDHYEPLWKTKDRRIGAERVRVWHHGYPTLAAPFRDSDGRPPRHSFFFPGEEYEPEYLDALASLARRGLGEVELHLHHDGDTAAGLRRSIRDYLARL